LQSASPPGKDPHVGLSQVFLARSADAAGRMAATPDLESTLQRLLTQARTAWPDLSVPDDAFMQHLAECLRAETDPIEALGAVHASDLYLALACARGEAVALQIFEEHFVAGLSSYLARREALPAFADEVKQALRERILLGAARVLPRIAGYNGQGPLIAWLRIAAVRLASNIRRETAVRQQLETSAEEVWPILRSPVVDPELAHLKTKYSADLNAALHATLASLGKRERMVLRLHYLEGMNATSIATLCDVSQRTVERWLVGARTRIVKRTRELLGARLHIEPSQLDTLVGLVQSQLDPGLIALLAPRRPSRT
jgi:RNA polymerase sigma-70 factor (ECF subfamily)